MKVYKTQQEVEADIKYNNLITMNCKICGKELTTVDIDNLCSECRNKEPRQTYLMGWECPRCRKIHSPYCLKCDCAPSIKDYIGTNPDDNITLCNTR